MNTDDHTQSSRFPADLERQYSDATIFMHDAIAKKVGLSSSDHKYLGILIQEGTMTAGELSHKTGLTTGAVTGLIDRLEFKKLVTREFDPSDRRKIHIVPDYQKAMLLLGGIFDQLQEKMKILRAQFTPRELNTIEQYLHSAILVMNEVTRNLNEE